MYRKIHTNEARNLALAGKGDSVDLARLMEAKVTGRFWELLEDQEISLVVSREYEHFLVMLGNGQEGPSQSAMEMPHPSGICVDERSGEVHVASTRTPHQIFSLRPLTAEDWSREILPDDFARPEGQLYIPQRSVMLPGDLYGHDLALVGSRLCLTATGHNFLAEIDSSYGWRRVWWPRCVEALGDGAFKRNCLQLNSIAAGATPEESFFTAFSDQTSGPKPWKEGYGPNGKGVLFSGATREVVLRSLTCPHSARFHGGRLWLCNSGFGEVNVIDLDASGAVKGSLECVLRLPGFTRGLCFHGDYAFVGLSKVIDFYEPYAPGLTPAQTVCGIAAFHAGTGVLEGMLTWVQGYQIYDVQVLPGVRLPLLPTKNPGDEFNMALRFLG